MNAIAKALDELKFIIPKEILEAVFMQKSAEWRTTPTSLDNQIVLQVIRPRVLVDCNLIGGMEVFIPLDRVPVEQVNIYTQIYRIPKSLTQGRSIISLISINFNDPTSLSNYATQSTNQTSIQLQLAQGVMDAQGSMPMVSTADLQLIDENVVMVKQLALLPANVWLRCRIANDENLNHLQPRSYLKFAKAVEYAVKAYIYKESIIQIGTDQLYAGQQLGVYKEIVNSFSDAEQNYQDYRRDVLQKMLQMNDHSIMDRMIKMTVGGYR